VQRVRLGTPVRELSRIWSRGVPIPDQAAAAFSRLRGRGDFTGPDD
jgi:hypothetical protein